MYDPYPQRLIEDLLDSTFTYVAMNGAVNNVQIEVDPSKTLKIRVELNTKEHIEQILNCEES